MVFDDLDPSLIERLAPNPDATVRIVVDLEGEDAERLERIAIARGEKPREVIWDLLRGADRPAA